MTWISSAITCKHYQSDLININSYEPRGVWVQIGSFVPAESVRMHVFDSVSTRMGASDNLAMGRSTFLEVAHPNQSGLFLSS